MGYLESFTIYCILQKGVAKSPGSRLELYLLYTPKIFPLFTLAHWGIPEWFYSMESPIADGWHGG